MTRELQHAMAQYEEARIRYRKAVLASLNGDSNGGDAIREAIKGFQVARAELSRHGGGPAAQPPEVSREQPRAWGFVRRLLNAG